jgi:hypothetical protein
MSYFTERIAEMQMQENDFELELKNRNPLYGMLQSNNQKYIRETSDGDIEIIPFTVERKVIEYEKENTRKTFTDKGENLTLYSVLRLNPENINGTGKYRMPSGVGTYPFITKETLNLFEKKSEIRTLYLTEGYLKAIAAGHHTKLPFVGLGSITLYKNEDGELYDDIKKIIEVCKVQNVMMVYDGDCRNISDNGTDKKSHTDRPHSFFSSALNLRSYLTELGVNFYFCSIQSDRIKDNPKGIDDLILSNFDDLDKITLNLSKLTTDKTYFFKIDCTASLSKLRKYLHLDDYKDFFEYHRAKIGLNEFKFFGTRYQYNLDKDKLDIVMPEAAHRYIRVGDDYFEKIEKPTIQGTTNNILQRRQKSTIRDDHGAKIFKFISKYTDFIVIPQHFDYKEIQDGFYNMYKPFVHEPAEGNFPHTEMYLKHIFSEQGEVGYWLGLDYIQLLLQRPTQILPILCLVSEENSTGKTMFATLLNELFRGNVAIIGNAEISSDFNGHLLGKLVIAIDESFIDKKLVIEKIKSLATKTEIPMTKKGKDTVFVDFFGKLILLSNNVDNFISANEFDQRYWVLTVPEPKEKDADLFDKIKKEIPAFLYFLQKRKMYTQKEHRAWFRTDLIKTKSLQKVIDKNKPSAQKEIEIFVKEMFEKYRISTFGLCLKDISTNVFKDKMNQHYIKEILQKMNIEKKRGKYKYPTSINELNEADEHTYNDIIFQRGNSSYYSFNAVDFGFSLEECIEEEIPF